MRYIILLLVVCGSLFAKGALASTPAQMQINIPLGSETVISWASVEGVHHYRLTGTFYAVRSSATSCVLPLVNEQQTLTINETLSPSTTEFSLPLPALPPEDVWILYDSMGQIQAFDADEVLLAQGNARGIQETASIACATATPGVVLPNTGSGANSPERTWPVAATIAAAIATMGAVLVAFSARRRD
jgi:hypothetical protein